MLRFADELLLLLIDDKRGDLIPIPQWPLACALAGALLMDLAQEGRIDTDPDHLSLLDARPLDDELLDPVLADIAQAETAQDARFWVAHFAAQGDDIRDKTLNSLTAQGILEADEGGFFAFLPSVSRHPPLPGGPGGAGRRAVARHAGAVQQRHSRSARHCHHQPGGSLRRLRTPAVPRRARGGARAHCPPRPHGPDRPRGDRGDPVRRSGRRCPVPGPPPGAEGAATGHQRTAGHSLHPQRIPAAGTNLRDREESPDAGPRGLLHHQAAGQAGMQYNRKLIVMAGPETNRFFQKNDKAFFRSREFWMPFDEQFDVRATRATLSMSGEDHFRMRRSKRPGYARAMGETQVPAIVDVMRREIASWPTERPIPATAMTKRLVYNLMCRVMTGISAPEYYDDFIMLFEAAFKSILGLYPGRLHRPRLRRARTRLDDLTAKIIRLHEPEHRGDRQPDVIDHLLAMHRSDPSFLPETDLGIVVLEPIFAPLDTLAHSLSFMLYELLKRPDLLQRAQAEADTSSGTANPRAGRAAARRNSSGLPGNAAPVRHGATHRAHGGQLVRVLGLHGVRRPAGHSGLYAHAPPAGVLSRS